MDHDQRFKAIIREFFSEFLLLFFRDWADRFDLSSVTWLDKEMLPNPPEGTRHQLDLVAQLQTREPTAVGSANAAEPWLAVVHIEIESPDQTTRLKPRLPRYYLALREQHHCPVLPIVVYLRVGLDGIGVDSYVDRFWEFEPLRFQYLYVGLPALDGLQYVQGENWLGVALSSLMRIPPERVAWLGAEALRRLLEAPLTDQQRYLLGDCVQAYLPLDETGKAEFERLIVGDQYSKVRTMNQTVFEKGLENGLQRGRQEGRHEGFLDAVRELLADKFGPIDVALEQRLVTLSADQLRLLLRAIPRANQLTDIGLPE